MARPSCVGAYALVAVLLAARAQSARKDYNFFPNLPAGEFRWYFKSMVACSSPDARARDALKFRHSLFVNKTSRSTIELRGSVTNEIPFDDSLTGNRGTTGQIDFNHLAVGGCDVHGRHQAFLRTLRKQGIVYEKESKEYFGGRSYAIQFNVNFAVKDSIGGWKDNAIVYRAPKSCSTSKRFLGDDWPLMMKAFGVNTTDCPIPPGTYVSRGYDLSDLGSKLNIPKSFFYGVYKLRIYFTNQNENICGCGIFVIEIKRPWEDER